MPVGYFYNDGSVFCSVKSDQEFEEIVSLYGFENCRFGSLHTYNATEDEYLYSKALCKFQHLMILKE